MSSEARVDEREQALVLVGLAQEEDGLVGEDLGSDVGAVACSHVVDEAREDNPVHSGTIVFAYPRKNEGAELAATSPPPTVFRGSPRRIGAHPQKSAANPYNPQYRSCGALHSMPQEVVHTRWFTSLERVMSAGAEWPIYTPGGDPRGSSRKRDCWGAAAQATREREAGESHRLSLLLTAPSSAPHVGKASPHEQHGSGQAAATQADPSPVPAHAHAGSALPDVQRDAGKKLSPPLEPQANAGTLSPSRVRS